MKLENSFDVDAPPEAAWALLMDVPRVIPCMPGAKLLETAREALGDTLGDGELVRVRVRTRPAIPRDQPLARRENLPLRRGRIERRQVAEDRSREHAGWVDADDFAYRSIWARSPGSGSRPR